MADVVARGFAQGTQPIANRMNRLRQKTFAPVTQETVEEMSRRSDEMWARYQASQKRLVS